MKIHAIFNATALLASLTLSTQANPNNYTARTFTSGSKSVNYRIFVPANYSATKKYPFMLALHGAGESGSDNISQLKHDFTNMWSDDAVQAKYPSFAVAPQAPSSSAGHDQALLFLLVASLQKEFSLDSTRLYISGLSMGAIAAWPMITNNPTKFAAAVPIAGRGDPSKAKALVNMPIWAFHGAMDQTVLPSGSRDMVNAIKAAGGTLIKYTEYPNVGHESWIPAGKEPELVPWIYSQVRGGVLALGGDLFSGYRPNLNRPVAMGLHRSAQILLVDGLGIKGGTFDFRGRALTIRALGATPALPAPALPAAAAQ